MDKDRVEGSAKEIKGKTKEIAGKVRGDASPMARPTRQPERSKMLSAASKTRSRGSNRCDEVLVAQNPMLRTVANVCRKQREQLAKNSHRLPPALLIAKGFSSVTFNSCHLNFQGRV
jgi:uncharacterized protein YjbJ (UPF0337 family)